MNIGLYIHIPFCRQKCLYCDFASYVNINHLYDSYVAALCREIAEQGGNFADSVVDTVYIGGGTPTLLDNDQLSVILECVRQNLRLDSDAEVSIEANPGTVDDEKLTCLITGGINRISFGVQSFSDKLLKTIGRIHTADEAVSAVNMALKAGFRNINLDLMYGLPGQDIEDIRSSIEIAAALNIQHLSLYGLKIEDETPFSALRDQGRLDLPNDELEEAMYDLVNILVPAKGFKRYEISNYARNGQVCRHNLKYWRYKPYLGVGVAAHSFFNGKRKANTSNVSEYIDLIEKGHSAVNFAEEISRENAIAEFCFLALRTSHGLYYDEFYRYFRQDFLSQYGAVVEKLKKRELIFSTLDGIRLTELGMKFGNMVFEAFLPDDL